MGKIIREAFRRGKKLKEAGKPDTMAGHFNSFTMKIFQNNYKNSAKTGEVGTLFAFSLIIYRCLVVSYHIIFQEEKPGFSVWGNTGFFIAGLCL